MKGYFFGHVDQDLSHSEEKNLAFKDFFKLAQFLLFRIRNISTAKN